MNTLVETRVRVIAPDELGGVADVAAAYAINPSTMATIASRAHARGLAPEPVCTIRRGAIYVMADWLPLLGRYVA